MASMYGDAGGAPILGGRPMRRGVNPAAILRALGIQGGLQASPANPAGPRLMGPPSAAPMGGMMGMPQAGDQGAAPLQGHAVGGLIPLPVPVMPKPPSPGALRSGLLQLLHPSIQANLLRGSFKNNRPVSGSVPQINRPINIPSTGAFHHTAAAAAAGPAQVRRQMGVQAAHGAALQAAARTRQMRGMTNNFARNVGIAGF